MSQPYHSQSRNRYDHHLHEKYTQPVTQQVILMLVLKCQNQEEVRNIKRRKVITTIADRILAGKIIYTKVKKNGGILIL